MLTSWAYKQGFLCVAYTDTLSTIPERLTHYWPCVKIPFEEVSEFLGTPAYDERQGVYAAQMGYGVGWVRFRLQNGTQTHPIETVREALPCPKVRKGIETRYRAGRWEKYLKSSGWVCA